MQPQSSSWKPGCGQSRRSSEPSMALVFLFLKLQYGPKGVYFTPTSSHYIYSFDYVLHFSKEVNKKDIHLLQVWSSMLWEEQKKRSEIIMNYGSSQDAVKKWKKKKKWKWKKVKKRPSIKSDSLRPHGLCSPPGSSVHGILQARILEWIAIPFSRGSSWLRDLTWVSRVASRFFTIWATEGAWSSQKRKTSSAERV